MSRISRIPGSNENSHFKKSIPKIPCLAHMCGSSHPRAFAKEPLPTHSHSPHSHLALCHSCMCSSFISSQRGYCVAVSISLGSVYSSPVSHIKRTNKRPSRSSCCWEHQRLYTSRDIRVRI